MNLRRCSSCSALQSEQKRAARALAPTGADPRGSTHGPAAHAVALEGRVCAPGPGRGGGQGQGVSGWVVLLSRDLIPAAWLVPTIWL